MKTLCRVLCIIVAVCFSAQASAYVYYVSPTGNNANDGLSTTRPLGSIQYALSRAVAGDSVQLMTGMYWEDLKTIRSGTSTKPITIQGGAGAVVRGAGAPRVFEINHDYITLTGFTIDGLAGAGTQASDYRDKLIYAISTTARQGVQGIKILNMTLKNAGGEGVRFRYFAKNNEIAYNTIYKCGVHDFVFRGGGKNGEGIYLGTAPEQWGLYGAPTADPDVTRDNWVHHNTIDTQGGECVDVKEAATANLVEDNICTGVQDAETGALDSRGNGNIFRYNQIFSNRSAGVRLGGDTASWAINNDVYENEIHDNAAGGIKFMNTPQGKVCGNTMYNNTGGDSVGTYKSQFNPIAACGAGGDTDTEPPTVSITSPANDAEVKRNANVTISADATDNVAVSKVEFYINGGLKVSDTSALYSYVWKVPGKANTTYTISAVAHDSSGNASTATITVISTR